MTLDHILRRDKPSTKCTFLLSEFTNAYEPSWELETHAGSSDQEKPIHDDKEPFP